MENKELIITDLMKDHLDKMAYWAKLFGVLGFIASALMVIGAIFMFYLGLMNLIRKKKMMSLRI